MRDVYQYLSKKMDAQDQSGLEPAAAKQLTVLREWLSALSRGDTSRSLAARSLGVLQRSSDLQDRELGKVLSNIWNEFALDFLAGEVRSFVADSGAPSPPTPIWKAEATPFHIFVAETVAKGDAIPLSVNFDGLTHQALSKNAKKLPDTNGIIVSDADQLARFALADPDSGHRLLPVVKIWGDVFHAVCRNRQCPKCGSRIPIYALVDDRSEKAPADHARELLRCSECSSTRQLQIYFAGYEEKERNTRELIEAFYRHYGNKIGLILVAGLSGEWDDLLIRLIENLALDLGSAGEESQTLRPTERRTSSRTSYVYCIDPSRSFLMDELTRKGIPFVHIGNGTIADEVGARLVPWPEKLPPPPQRPLVDASAADDNTWIGPLASKVLFTKEVKEIVIGNTGYLDDMRRLRQLGLKTKIIEPKDEHKHSRYIHSRGAAYVGTYWAEKVIEKLPSRFEGLKDLLRATVPVALINHDIGHVPFTHLAEELFNEVNWSARPWATKFRHDDDSLDRAWPELSKQWAEIAPKLTHAFGRDFIPTVRDAIRGNSGIHFLDAMINSPLDADKIDYIYRDCGFLRQYLHMPGIGSSDSEVQRRVKWLEEFCDGQVILESGVIGLRGKAGHHAAQLLEERMWLYKNIYYDPVYRVTERLTRSVVLTWLLDKVEDKIRDEHWRGQNKRPIHLGDPRYLKGCAARDILWEAICALPAGQGEPDLVLQMISDLKETPHFVSAGRADWIRRCGEVLHSMLDAPNSGEGADSATRLKKKATYSERIYCWRSDIETVQEIARELEVKNPFTILIDVAPYPRLLSYASSRYHHLGRSQIVCDCFAVPHPDPEKWESYSRDWIPLSQSHLAGRDERRAAQILVISPLSHDEANIHHFEDRLRNICRARKIPLFDSDPTRTPQEGTN
jgi:hypothetical protein